MHFTGEYPYDHEGNRLENLVASSRDTTLVANIVSNHSFSHKPPDGYPDYYAKVKSYADILSHCAEAIDGDVTARRTVRRVEPADTTTVFNYPDTNSSRAEIVPQADKLAGKRVGIIGVGGTGSYVLDFVAKTPVAEIHLFDGDDFLTHNAYRAPGAAELEALRAREKKVSYHAKHYSALHRKVVEHPYPISADNMNELSELDFVFICIDSEPAKQAIIEGLLAKGIPLVDTGIGMQVVDGKIRGTVRSTYATSESHQHIQNRVSYASDDSNDYSKNVQIAEVNALNAALAVIKWKKHFGYYHDLGKEHHTIYNIDNGQLLNEDY